MLQRAVSSPDKKTSNNDKKSSINYLVVITTIVIIIVRTDHFVWTKCDVNNDQVSQGRYRML